MATDSFDISSLPYGWLLALIIIAVACGAIGYIIASRRVKQPVLLFSARYGISFFLLFLLESALLSLVPSLHDSMRNLTASLVSGILDLARVSYTVSGPIITLHDPQLVFDVTVSCLGGMLFWIYIALVLAELKASPKQRLFGIIVGLVIIIVFNLFRIISSIYLEWLTSVHVHNFFYLLNMIFVLLLWAGWLWILKPKKTAFSKKKP